MKKKIILFLVSTVIAVSLTGVKVAITMRQSSCRRLEITKLL